MEEYLTAHNIIFSMQGAFLAYCMYRIDRKFDKIDRKFDKIDKRFDKLETKVDARFDKVDAKIEKIDRRLSHIEGSFFGKDLPKHIEMQEG